MSDQDLTSLREEIGERSWSLDDRQPKLNTQTDFAIFRHSPLATILMLVWLLADCSVGVVMMFASEWPWAWVAIWGLAGVVISQLLFTGFLFAMFPASFLFRFSLTMAALVGGVTLIGISTAVPPDLEKFQNMVWFGPPLLLGVSGGFAGLRLLFGWNLEFRWVPKSSPQPMSILSLLISVTLVAAAFSISSLNGALQIQATILFGLGFFAISIGVLAPLTRFLINDPKRWLVFGLLTLCSILAFLFAFQSPASPMIYWLRLGITTGFAMMVPSYCLAIIAVQQCGGKICQSRFDDSNPDGGGW